jgi:elongator complex protein 1
MYKETLKKDLVNGASNTGIPIAPTAVQAESKINRICDAFLEVLERRGNAQLQNIITAYVCKSPPDLEGGLGIVARLLGKNSLICQYGC